MNHLRIKTRRVVLGALAAALAGCGGSGSPNGDLTVAIQAEDTITEGLSAGTAEEQIVDGWNVTFDKYVTTFGELHLTSMAGGASVVTAMDLVVDLTTIPETGRVVRTGPLAEGRYAFEYSMPVATAGMTRDTSVSQADFDRMVAEGCSYLIAGTAENGTRTITFDVCLDAEADYACSSTDGMEGIVVSAGSSTAFMTVHGDHLFFNGFPAGDEAVVTRRAGWLALVDDATGADGTVDNADLEGTPISILPASDYALTGAPTVEGMAITNMSLYARAQLQTQGHLNGEGECLANGVGHMHLDRGL
ncbi:MAG: hypothetical protein K1X94_01545 [Sandaracinaceae bacterium]|nr:hypothetical protein [Sandaracinaceae bacterium]